MSGLDLKEPVLLDDEYEISELMITMGEGPSVPREQLAGRRYFELALFWGEERTEWLRRRGSVRPEEGNQFGRFYPASEGEGATIDLVVNGRSGPWPATDTALQIFARHGVAVSLPGSGDQDNTWRWIIGIVGGTAVLLIGTFLAFRLRSGPAPG